MATDGPTPPPCDAEVMKNGQNVCWVSGSSNQIENWVKSIAEKADARLDWHYVAGRGDVLHLGDEESRQRVLVAIKELSDQFGGQILSADEPEYTVPIVREEDGQLIIDDPHALAVVLAVKKHNCKRTLLANAERVLHFLNRINELGKSPEDVVIVLLNVDDQNGAAIANALMPGHDWQQFRSRGETPFARGIANRAGIQSAIECFDEYAAKKLRELTDGVAVVVVDHSTAEIFRASELVASPA